MEVSQRQILLGDIRTKNARMHSVEGPPKYGQDVPPYLNGYTDRQTDRQTDTQTKRKH